MSIRLRKLEKKDAPYMYEWMQNNDVTRYMRNDFAHMTLSDCVSFINKSMLDEKNIHMAIVNSNDEYQGTVSLKNISNARAEFAITIRASAMGQDISSDAMEKMIHYGLFELNLEYIYWFVSKFNKRAIRFYDKNGFRRIGLIESKKYSFCQDLDNYIWYIVNKEDNRYA